VDVTGVRGCVRSRGGAPAGRLYRLAALLGRVGVRTGASGLALHLVFGGQVFEDGDAPGVDLGAALLAQDADDLLLGHGLVARAVVGLWARDLPPRGVPGGILPRPVFLDSASRAYTSAGSNRRALRTLAASSATSGSLPVRVLTAQPPG